MNDTRDDVAERLFGAIERGDIDAVADLFSPAVAVWKSGDSRDNDHARSVRIIDWFITATAHRRYEVQDRRFFEDGFVQRHILHATGHHGAVIAMPVCIVIILAADGLITRIDEYFDPADIAPLLRAA